MSTRRFLAASLAILFVVTPLAALVSATTEQTFNGDVVVNGAFTDARTVGHPLKIYCDANNPTPLEGPSGECAHANQFVAFDWTTPVDDASGISLVSGGIHLSGNVFIQQHFNGSDAPDRTMQVFRVAVTGSSAVAHANNLRVEIRADGNGDGAVDSYSKLITLPTGGATVDVTAAQLGIPAGPIKVRSVRLWASSAADITISRVSVYATNGIDGRNLLIRPAGDDVVSANDGAMVVNPGADGKYSFLVGMATDSGQWLPTLDGVVCVYSAEQAIADHGFPKNLPNDCNDAIVRPTSPGVVKTKVGDVWQIDIPAKLVQPSTTNVPAVAVYGIVKVDASYSNSAPGVTSEFKTGYLNLQRLAAADAGAGVSQEWDAATPVLIDANADGKPDYVQTQESDGYSVIITPELSTVSPFVSVVTTDINGNYAFDVQVYKYDATTGTGAAMDLPGGVDFGLFDAQGAASGAPSDTNDIWRLAQHPADAQRVDAKTWRVIVPGSQVPGNTPLGAWAFYDVGLGKSTSFAGTSRSSTDFYSELRNSVKGFSAADAMRTMMTPILLDGESLTRDATLVIKLDPTTDDITPLDGTLVMGDKGDGRVSFEYAMVVPDGHIITTNGAQSFALYDAAGLASDGGDPSGGKHALWTGAGSVASDGWFRVEVPTSAFANAKGGVVAWAHTDTTTGDGIALSRAGYYNLIKGALASVSTSAAQNAVLAPTPIVLLDDQLGIPATLSSAIAGAGTDLLSVTNPLVNPGFEANLLVDGKHDSNDNLGGTMTAPPWFLRLDDQGTGQNTVPASTQTVVSGAGRLNDNALQIAYKAADHGKTLMLGQLLGNENGGNALVWQGASGIGFDIKIVGTVDLTLTASIRYLASDGSVAQAFATRHMTGSPNWYRVELPVSVPADAKLLALYLVIDSPASLTLQVDNLAIEGATTAMGDARTDLTDGYAVIIEPQGLSGDQQSLVQGADGRYYVYKFHVVDYTHGAPQTVDLTGRDVAFALRTQDLQRGGGILLAQRGSTTEMVALVKAADVPAQAAAPWAFVGVGSGYATLATPIVNQPASGHYDPVKNALQGAPIADQLDYAATPVVFGSNVAETHVSKQTIELPLGPSGRSVVIAADDPYVESTTLTITSTTQATRTFVVPLTSEGTTVPGLVLSDDELEHATLTTSGTHFTQGTQLIGGSPVASFTICRTSQSGCIDTGILSGESLAFHSTSASPSGEPLTNVWTFGDGATTTTASATTVHAYARPGAKTVTLTVQTPSGKTGSAQRTITINDQAPTIAGIDISPSAIFVDSQVSVRARASDADGGTLAYAWTINGVDVPGVTGSLLKITPAILDATTGSASLQKRAYAVGVTVTDGQGGLVSGVASFTVGDRPAFLSAPRYADADAPTAAYPLVGEHETVAVTFSDVDDVADHVTFVLDTPDAAGVEIPLDAGLAGAWTGSFPTTSAGQYAGHAVAYRADDSILATGAAGGVEARVDSPPVVTIAGPTATNASTPETFTVTASDPDGRGILGFGLAGAGNVLSCTGCAGSGPATFSVSFEQVGNDTLVANATDATGQSGTATATVSVDDIIHVSAAMYHAAENVTDGHLVKITVTDVNGQPISNAKVVVDDFYETIPRPVDSQTVHTDRDGVAFVRLKPEAQVIGLPISRHVDITATAASVAEAPVQDIETASTSIDIHNGAGPLGGLPLP